MNTTLRRWIGTAIAVIAVVAVSGCGRQATSYETPRALAAALAEADIPCASLQAGAEVKLVESSATCRSGAADLGLFVFSSQQQRDRWLLVGGQLGPVAVGPNWVMRGDASDLQVAAQALGARLR